MLIDLQLHSKFSDGYLSPKELVNIIKKKGIKVASLTDHNTISGQEEFRAEAKKMGIKTIPGLELYVKHKKRRINLLWYNFNEKDDALISILNMSRKSRIILVGRALRKLKRRGFKIDIADILSKFDNYIPVNRLGDEIMKSKFNYNLVVRNLRKRKGDTLILPLREEDFLGELFFNKKYGILNESYINAERLVKLKKRVGGQIVFCHPGRHNKFTNNMTEKLKKSGVIDGIEVLSPHHSIGSTMYSQFLAEKFDLIATGGSDFHRSEGGYFKIQNCWDWFIIDSTKLRRIKEIIGS